MNELLKTSPRTSRSKSTRMEVRLRVLRALEENPELSQRQLAEELGISLGGVNYAVKALVERGLVKMKNFGRSDSKLGYVYLLTPAGMKQKSELAAAFLSRKLEEYEVLRREIEVLRLELGDSKGTGACKAYYRTRERSVSEVS
jgi:EPS-associated MarR family transcriptional regulator